MSDPWSKEPRFPGAAFPSKNHLLDFATPDSLSTFLMPLPCGRPALRLLCVCALFAGTASSASARQPGAPDEGAINLDQAVQALKDEAVQFNRDAQLAEDEFLYPPQTRVTIFVSNRMPLLLSEISVTVDDAAPVTYRYGEVDSRALLEPGALQRLLQLNVDRGTHRIRASYTGQYNNFDKDAKPVSGAFEAVFDKGLEPAEIELQIRRDPRKGTPGMNLREWRAQEE